MKILVTQTRPKASTVNCLLLEKGRHAALALTLLLLAALPALAQNNILVRGHVTNEKNQPVVNASVTLKNSASGTATNASGDFEISAPANATLVVSSVGYAAKEIAVDGRTTINLTLSISSTDMEQVVVVGYGTQKRKDVTGSVVSVGETALREVPAANLTQSLQGRAAGLQIERTGTTPGSVGQIRIRGMKSILGSNDPLLVVDGIPFSGTLNDINPDDVASVDVLKDASATAIYGSRGANGVIIITLKKGRQGETRVSYNGYHGIATVADKYPVFNAAEYQAMRNTSTWGQGYLPEEIKGIALGRQTDWQDLMYGNGYRTDHNITVSGGSGGSTFSLGGGYYKETAVLPGQDFTRYSLRASIDSRAGRKIRVGLSTFNSAGVTNGSQFVNSGTMFPILALTPLTAPYDSAGNLVFLPNGNIDDNNAPTYSPLLLKNNNNSWVDRVRRLRTFNTLYGEYQITKGLRYRINLGLSYAQQESDQFQGSGDTAKATRPTHPNFFRGFKGNTASVNNGETWGYTVENILYYDKSIGKHNFSFTGLYSIEENHSHNTFVQKDSITEDFVQFYNLAQSSPTPAPVVGGGESSWALISYMARLNYNYNDKYLVTVTGRTDGSSRLAEGHKWHQYPAVSLGWNILNESFASKALGRINISTLKLRAGFGQVSNQAINPYDALGLVSNGNGLTSPGNILRYNYGPTIVTGYNVTTLPNKDLDWEYSKTFNIGLDFGVLRNRISGSIDVYKTNTVKLLNNITLPATSGVSGQFPANVGELENKGLELSISSTNILSRNGFSWNTDLNLFFNRNKIVKLANGQTQDIANQLFQGYSMTAIYDYKKLGIWQTSEAAEAARYGSVPGQIKLEDWSGPNGKPDGTISDYDRHIIGNGDAKLQGGMTNRFYFKGIDLSIVMYARLGGTLISQVHQPFASYLTVMDGRRNGIKVDYWTPNNPSNWFPMPQVSISPVSTAWTTLGYYDASFVKIRSINLGYTFNRSWLKSINAQNVRFYFTIDNVATLFSPYYKQTGIDPEGTGVGSQGVSNPGNIRGNGRGNGTVTIGVATPPSRTFTFGANISL